MDKTTSNFTPELLAPAGGPEAGYAALHYGADAVYLGMKQFSARSEAENFSVGELETFVAFAHSLTPPRRVYVTLNTLIRNDELGEAAGVLLDCVAAGSDAVIVQDLGVARMVRALVPGLSLHASTQMAIHSRDGVIGVRQAGFSRVNMARELTVDELRDCATVPGIELEVFIHGALCYSYSGLCLYSSLLRGRSGNRGTCAYPCRDRFRSMDQAAADGVFAFSMKDLALPGQIGALRAAGVASLKIEGRKKSPLYVATVTALYRRILDGDATEGELAELAEDVKTVFSRPWTTLFSKGRRNADTIDTQTVGHRGARVGDVIAVRGCRDGSRLRFTPLRTIERHDGIQVDVQGQDKPFGFSVQSLYRIAKDGSATSVFEAAGGTLVDVTLPLGAPLLSPGAPVYCASSQKTKRDYPFNRPNPNVHGLRFRLDVTLHMTAQQIAAEGEVFDGCGEKRGDGRAGVDGVFATAKEPARCESVAREAFTKLGDTPFVLGLLRVDNPDALFAPVSLLNKLRRELTTTLADMLSEQSQAYRNHGVALYTVKKPKANRPVTPETWSVALDRVETLDAFTDSDLTAVDEVIFRLRSESCREAAVRIQRLSARFGLQKIRIGLPLIVRGSDREDTVRAVNAAIQLGITRWEVNGTGGRQLLASVLTGHHDIMAGWPLYARNREAITGLLDGGYSRVTVSPEDGLKDILPLVAAFGDRMTVPVFFDPPLMIAESCAVAAFDGGCQGQGHEQGRCSHREDRVLRSASGNEQVVLCQEQCRSIVLNRAPFSRLAHVQTLRAAGARHFLGEFVYRQWNGTDAAQAWQKLRKDVIVGEGL